MVDVNSIQNLERSKGWRDEMLGKSRQVRKILPQQFDHLQVLKREARTDLWLSSTSDAEIMLRCDVGFQGSDLSPSSSAKLMSLLMSLTEKMLLIVLYAVTMEKISWRHESSLTIPRSTNNGLVSGMTYCLCRRILRFRTLAI